MLEGINWDWETYLSIWRLSIRCQRAELRRLYRHSALRTYVMYERAFEEEATEDDMEKMKNAVKEAVTVGAMGFDLAQPEPPDLRRPLRREPYRRR